MEPVARWSAALAFALLASCASRVDRQVEAAIDDSRRERERVDPTFSAQVLARPAWLDAAPVGVDDVKSRDPGRALAQGAAAWRGDGASAQDLALRSDGRRERDTESGDAAVDAAVGADETDNEGESEGENLRPRAVRVRGALVADARALEGVLRSAGCSLGVAGTGDADASAAIAPQLDVRVEATDESLLADIEVRVRAGDVGRLAALGIVARSAAWDAGDARSGGALIAIREELVVAPETAPVGTAVLDSLVVRVADDAPFQVREVADCIAIGAASLVADPRAGDLGRYLFALDGAFQAGAEAIGVERGGMDPRGWHREARRALRRMCLRLEPADEAPLEAPDALPPPIEAAAPTEEAEDAAPSDP